MVTHSGILAWKIHGQRSWVGYSPWGHKELDTTVRPTHIRAPTIGTHLTCSIASAETLDVVTFFLNQITFYFF